MRALTKADFARIGEDRETIERVLERTKDLEERTNALTGALRSMCPRAAVSTCALTQNGHRHG